jgi:cytochrome P450
VIHALGLRLGLWGAGFAAVVRLVGQGFAAWRAGRLAALLAETPSQRLVFTALRAFAPNLVLQRRFITGYANGGTAIITRHADVTEVLEREADFAVVYEPKMRLITAGENFFLGMQDSAEYTRDVSAMRLAVRREDVPSRVIPLVAGEAAAILARTEGGLDVAADLTRRVPARLALRYFGLPADGEDHLIAWTTVMFWYLFVDLAGEERVSRPALEAAAECHAWLDAAIADRHANPTGADDVLNRCLALQAAGVPGMDDLGIRNNLIGLLIGLVPTLSKASILALEELLKRPDALAQAQEAARGDDDARLADILFEALRFSPMNPVIYRRANREVVVARGTRRAVTIPQGHMVLAANLSAMFDPLVLERPEEFHPGRPWDHYMLWGYGMHACFGGHINRVAIPQMLKPLLRRERLRATAPPDGAGTPFPAHYPLTFNP